jgi:hypothetical protein
MFVMHENGHANMSLYYVQKLIYQLNRDPLVRKRFEKNANALLEEYELTAEELTALKEPDIGLLFVYGVNGQLLMHYAALFGIEWFSYLEAMREGVRKYGPVREGVYAMTGGGRDFTGKTQQGDNDHGGVET